MTSLQYYLQPIRPNFGNCTGFIDWEMVNGIIRRKLCGRILYPPYYVSYVESCNRLYSDPCMNPDDEAIQTVKLAEFIKCIYERYDLNSFGGPGAGTEEGRKAIRNEFMYSTLQQKERICQQCYDKKRVSDETMRKMQMSFNETEALQYKDFLEEEKKRRSTPITSQMTDLERYVISLPDRSYMLEKELGYDYSNHHHGEMLDEYWFGFDADMESIFTSEDPQVVSKRTFVYGESGVIRTRQQIRNFIKDKDRVFPNEQEITTYLQQHHNDFGFEIQYCKIFELGTDNRGRPKFTIIIHFSRPKGYWMIFHIPTIVRVHYPVSRYISSRVIIED